MQTLILVDEKDKETGTIERNECHRIPGRLHRAILVVLKNHKNEFLLGKRSKEKTLWPGIWDGTVATHVLKGETPGEAAGRALEKELDIENLPLKHLGGFVYRAKWEEKGEEYEYCHLFLGKTEKFKADPLEISETIWAKKEDLKKFSLTPWFSKALNFCNAS